MKPKGLDSKVRESGEIDKAQPGGGGRSADSDTNSEHLDSAIRKLFPEPTVHSDRLLEVVTPEDYNVNDFYCKSTFQGRTEHINLTVPMGTKRLLMGLVDSIPYYDTMQSVVRDAITHRVHHLAHSYAMPPEVLALKKALAAKARIDTISEAAQALKDIVTEARATLEMTAREKDWANFGAMVEHAMNLADELASPYDAQMRALLKEHLAWHGEELRAFYKAQDR